MKLASLKHGRDGKLAVVSHDLSSAVLVPDIAETLQAALDAWDDLSPRLADVYKRLNAGQIDSFSFDPAACASPLPRAYQWLDGSAYMNHVELARKARGAEMPPNAASDPLMYQGGSDSFLGPRDDIVFPTEDYGVDFEGEVAIITGDVPMATPADKAAAHIRLVMLVNDISLRVIAQAELGKGFGFVQGKPSSAFSPVAVTPEEIGDAWQDTKIHLPLTADWNDKNFGHPNAGVDMTFSFAQLIAHAARTRPLAAGTIIGSGTVSNYDRSTGHVCIVEKRMSEKVETGKASTPFMAFGDTIKIDMKDQNGQSVFGAIEQKLVQG